MLKFLLKINYILKSSDIFNALSVHTFSSTFDFNVSSVSPLSALLYRIDMQITHSEVILKLHIECFLNKLAIPSPSAISLALT